MTIPYNPAPTPPKITSPSIRLIMATIPASGDKLSCMAFTDPLDAAVVVVDQRMLLVMPNLVSFPSISGNFPKIAFEEYSAYREIDSPISSKISIAVKIVHPCRVDPTIFP